MSGHDPAREIRLELMKRIGNLRFQCLKGLYNRGPIVERYLNLRPCVLHIHLEVEGAGLCVRYNAADSQPHPARADDDGWVPVLISVREIGENPRPLASIARLQLLDQCDMGVIYSNEVGGNSPTGARNLPLLPTSKDLWIVINRKLSAVLNGTRIDNGKAIDEIIKGGAQIVGNLADQNADDFRRGILRRLLPMLPELLFIEILGSELSLRLLKETISVSRSARCFSVRSTRSKALLRWLGKVSSPKNPIQF